MRCCPPDRGCNIHRRQGNLIHGGEECLGRAARRSLDSDLGESVDFWWRRYRRLPLWRHGAKREALRAYRQAVALAFAAGLAPKTTTLSPPWGAGFNRERALRELNDQLIEVSHELALSSDGDIKLALAERKQEIIERLEHYRHPQPQILAFPPPKPPPAGWVGLPELT